MILRIIEATQAKTGTTILVDGEPYAVRSNDISKTGKHGASKCRIEAIGVFSDKKKIIAVPGHERFEVPAVNKGKAQVLNLEGDTVSVMDLESYENFSIPYLPELKDQLQPESQVEYWEIGGRKVIMRVL